MCVFPSFLSSLSTFKLILHSVSPSAPLSLPLSTKYYTCALDVVCKVVDPAMLLCPSEHPVEELAFEFPSMLEGCVFVLPACTVSLFIFNHIMLFISIFLYLFLSAFFVCILHVIECVCISSVCDISSFSSFFFFFFSRCNVMCNTTAITNTHTITTTT